MEITKTHADHDGTPLCGRPVTAPVLTADPRAVDCYACCAALRRAGRSLTRPLPKETP